MKDYINKGDASKLSLEELKQTPSNANYILHHSVKSVNKPGKVRDKLNNFFKRKSFQRTRLIK